MKKLIAVTALCIIAILALFTYEKRVSESISNTTKINTQAETEEQMISEKKEEDNKEDIISSELEKLKDMEFEDVEKLHNIVGEEKSDEISDGLISIRIFEHEYCPTNEYDYEIVNVYWEVPRVDASVADKYEKLDDALYNDGVQRRKEAEEYKIKTLYNSKDYREFYNYSTASIMRSDTSTLSVLYSNYKMSNYETYGDVKYESANYISETGEELEFSALVKDKNTFIGLVDEQLKSKYSDIYDQLLNLNDYFAKTTDKDICFTLSNNGVTMYFNAGVMGSESLGGLIITVPYDNLDDIIDNSFMPFVKSYITPIIESESCFYADADGDGKRECYQCEKVETDEDFYSWKISNQDKTIEVDQDEYGTPTYLVCDKGTCYMYFFGMSEDDYIGVSVIDLNSMCFDESKADEFGTDYYIDICDEKDESLLGYKYAIIDPANFKFV